MDAFAVGLSPPTSTLAPPQPSRAADPNSRAAAAGAAGSTPVALPQMSGDVVIRSDGSVDGAATFDRYRQAIHSVWSSSAQSPAVQHALEAASADPATRAAGISGRTHDAAQAYSSASSAVKSCASAVRDAATDALNVRRIRTRQRRNTLSTTLSGYRYQAKIRRRLQRPDVAAGDSRPPAHSRASRVGVAAHTSRWTRQGSFLPTGIAQPLQILKLSTVTRALRNNALV